MKPIKARFSTLKTTGLKTNTLKQQIQRLVLAIIIPFIIFIGVLYYIMTMFNQQYAASLKNANTVAELNYEFKKNVDQETYQFIIHARPLEELPLGELEHAKTIFEKLKSTTTSKDNKWRVQVMINLIERLRLAMIDIGDTKGYDDRIYKLNSNVQSITTLIQTYMHDYTYFEVQALSALQKTINHRVSLMIGITLIIGIPFIIIILTYSLLFSGHITRPIHQLSEKATLLGSGNFKLKSIQSTSSEIQTLDYHFNEMADRIDELLECVKEDQKALHRAELELLQAQINPHFLYNTFDSVIWLAETKENDKVIQMVTSLSTFFRTSLSKGQDFIPLGTEINQVASYLEIQQIRYFDILEYELDIFEHLKVYSIPKLTLQPLVENAIYHGIKNKRGKGKIVIRSLETENEVHIIIKDNGAGMTPEQLKLLQSEDYLLKASGLGIQNVCKRLKLYFGPDYGLSFDSVLGEGTTVTVRMPKTES